MKEIETKKTVFQVELTRAEIEYIVAMTQNYCGPDIRSEHPKEMEIRRELFIGAAKILGIPINDDGSINRGNLDKSH